MAQWWVFNWIFFSGTAGVAKGMSNYIDALTDNSMKKFFMQHMPINIDFMAEYPDFFAFGLVIVITSKLDMMQSPIVKFVISFIIVLIVLLAVGVKESTRMNNVFTVLNLLTVAIVIVAGSTKGI